MPSSRFLTFRLPAIALFGLVAAGCSNAPESNETAPSAASVEIAADDSTLTDADVELFIDSARKFKVYAAAHPDFDSDQIGAESDESPAEYAARVAMTPDLKAAFDDNGVDPAAFARATSLVTGAMFGAAMAQGQDGKSLPQPVQYYLTHKADIDRRIQQAGLGD